MHVVSITSRLDGADSGIGSVCESMMFLMAGAVVPSVVSTVDSHVHPPKADPDGLCAHPHDVERLQYFAVQGLALAGKPWPSPYESTAHTALP
jgi:hypothetical protein